MLWEIDEEVSFARKLSKSVQSDGIPGSGGILRYIFKCFVIYLPTIKDLVGYYKFWNEVMVWFMQMIFYNVYIPLQMMRRKIQVLYNILYHCSNIYPSADSRFFQLSATGCLAFLTFRLFRAASTPIICCIYRCIFFLL